MLLAACFLALSIVGCNRSGIERVVVTGQVKYNDEPIENGVIRFAPEAGTRLPVAAGQIKKGHYEVTRHGGVPVGTHRIEVTSYVAADGSKVENLLSSTTPTRQLLPGRFNRKSDITREIPAEDPFTLDLDLRD